MIEFNINNYVQIKLTDTGRAILEENHDRLHNLVKGNIPYKLPKEDADGWSKWQLWRVMEEFGPDIYHGNTPPFETTIRIMTDTSAPLEPDGSPSCLTCKHCSLCNLPAGQECHYESRVK